MSGRRVAPPGAVLAVAVAVAVAVAIAFALPASANHTSQTDRNDVAGRFDLESVRFDHDSPPRWTFVTFARWTVPQVWDRGYLLVELDTLGNEEPDFVAVVRSEGRDLDARLFRLRRDGYQVEVDTLASGKEGGRSAWVEVAPRKLTFGRSRTSYFWSALSSFTAPECPHTCVDRVPDEGMVEEILPGVTPSPTPSPTPTPTPSPSPTP
jgi:hypothetical protein